MTPRSLALFKMAHTTVNWCIACVFSEGSEKLPSGMVVAKKSKKEKKEKKKKIQKKRKKIQKNSKKKSKIL